MARPPVPSREEIVRLYKSGGLTAELGRNHETGEEGDDRFVERCVALHNSGEIDLLALTRESEFDQITGSSFFLIQHFYCETIPKLQGNVSNVMECCKLLVEKGGNDLAANQPNGAFRSWCQSHPAECANVIERARAGDALARQFVTFALQAANDVEGAIEFVEGYNDDRQLSGMAALGGLAFPDATSAETAVAILERYITDGNADNVRINALVAAFRVLDQDGDAAAAERLITSAANEPGPKTLFGLARVVQQHGTRLDAKILQVALTALQAVEPEHLGTMREIDAGLRQALRTDHDSQVLDFLTEKLQDTKFKLDLFQSTKHELVSGERQRLYNLIVRWFLSGSSVLCDTASDLVSGNDEQPFETTVEPLQLTPIQQLFLCRKAVGFLFLRPVVCCSIIVSVLRARAEEIRGAAADLLFDPMMLNYGGSARDYISSISFDDSAYDAVQTALAKAESYYRGLEDTGTIKELHPSEYQRNVVRHRMEDEMRGVRKAAESKSVFLNLVHRSTILYGTRSRVYVEDPGGKQRAVEMELKPFSTSVEWPRGEVLDPVGLDYMLRVFRGEKLK